MNFIKRIKELWINFVLFRFALIIHLSYFIISYICVLTIFREQNDFLIYFNAGGIFYNDINNLYDQDQYLWDYRYLPLSAVFFVPFYLLGFELGFTIFHVLNLIVNIFTCIFLYKICNFIKGKDHEKDDKRIIIFISFYLMAIPHMFNYILGQINSFITLFMLISLYIFLKYSDLRWQFIGSLILGFSIIVKPTAILMIPFLMFFRSNSGGSKKYQLNFFISLVRFIGIILPIATNLFFFIIYPELWEGFVRTNFTGSNPITLNFSFSITKLWLNFCYIYNIPFNQIIVLICITVILTVLGLFFYIYGSFDRSFNKNNQNNSILYGFIFGMLIILLAYYDSWDHHLLNLIPLLIITIFEMPRDSEITKKYIKQSLFFFCFFDLAFFGVWFLTMYYFYFPYNFASTIFLILIFYAICKYGLNNKGVR